MILDAAKHITTVLSLPEIAAQLGENIFWELAEQETQPPFLVFNVKDNGPRTKNRISIVEATVRVFGTSMSQSATIGEIIRETIRESEYRWKDRGAASGYVDTEAKEGFIEIKYEFNL